MNLFSPETEIGSYTIASFSLKRKKKISSSLTMKKREIGNGWKEVTGEDGKIFYVNKKLRKRQWDWPEDVPQEDEMEFPAPPDDDELPGPPEDGDMPPPPGSSRRLGLANIAKETAATTVTAEDLDAAKRRLMGGKKKDAFGKVNVRKLIDEDVDGDWDYVFKDFATTAFDSKVSGGFFGSHKVKMEDLLKHTTKHMGQGLLKRSNETSESKEEASQMHKNILSYMGDRKSGKDKMGHTQKILKYALDKLNDDDEEGSSKRRSEKDTKSTTEFPGLWDEIYCQLVKQTTSNAKTESLMSGFELFTLCAGTFKCTQSLYPYIMSHLDRAKRGDLEMPSGTAQNEEKRIKKLARRAQIRLRKTCLMPQRKYILSWYYSVKRERVALFLSSSLSLSDHTHTHIHTHWFVLTHSTHTHKHRYARTHSNGGTSSRECTSNHGESIQTRSIVRYTSG